MVPLKSPMMVDLVACRLPPVTLPYPVSPLVPLVPASMGEPTRECMMTD